ncbi:L-lactate permease [Carboxydochorda subterranea]|uniref:L-lactate permease n=1 Tax=Carboxydichorda subterranea TaxID=3109565 RepID=A0ABZ1C1A5_9FIRM|nr:L-lactate permease [Limnochorda sp. L945t]WRP18719.1 L-lactate permease [Limnochorda sp. L945t]
MLQAAVPDALALGAEVGAIMLGGVLLYELMRRAGAYRTVGAWLAREVADPAGRLLLMTLGVAPFVESVTGFGVGAVVTYPLFVQMGFAPQEAGILALLGLVAVPCGALAPGTLVASKLAGVSFQSLGEASAALSLPVFLICGGAAMVVGMGWRQASRQTGKLLIAAASLWGGIWLANRFAGTPPAGALGSLAGIGAGLVMGRASRDPLRTRGSTWERAAPRPEEEMPVVRALVPYVALVGLLVMSPGVVSLAAKMGWSLEAAAGSSLPWLWATCGFASLWFRLSLRTVAAALREALARWAPAALTTVLFVLLGNVMRVSGMAMALAEEASELRWGYLALAPWVGALGGFITGSNTGANAMFAAAQAGAAVRLGYPRLTSRER